MSSTNRSDARAAHKSDYYVTPIPAIERFLRAFCVDIGHRFQGRTILDPCAGGDATHPMSYPAALGQLFPGPGTTIITADIRPDSLATWKRDFLTSRPGEYYDNPDIVITNPPFNAALEIIRKSLEIVKPGGLVIMLLRLNFFGSQSRAQWLKNNMPTWCYVHSKRMSFTDCGGTDSIEYCHFVWVQGEHPAYTQLRII